MVRSRQTPQKKKNTNLHAFELDFPARVLNYCFKW